MAVRLHGGYILLVHDRCAQWTARICHEAKSGGFEPSNQHRSILGQESDAIIGLSFWASECPSSTLDVRSHCDHLSHSTTVLYIRPEETA
jgi:hypothetical protein